MHWLTDPAARLFSIIAVDTWKGVGFIMVLLLAGIESIPREFHDAARIDGASGFKEFRYITLPLLKPVLTVTTVLNLLYGLKVFDSVFVLTNGGPGYATETVNTIVFKEFGARPLCGQHGAVHGAVPDHDHRRPVSSSGRCTSRSTMPESATHEAVRPRSARASLRAPRCQPHGRCSARVR